jgi:hypothetical protein
LARRDGTLARHETLSRVQHLVVVESDDVGDARHGFERHGALITAGEIEIRSCDVHRRARLCITGDRDTATRDPSSDGS